MRHAWWLLAFLLLQEAPTLTREEFAKRRAALAARLPDGAIALDTGPITSRNFADDAVMPLLDFKYLTGFHDDEGVLVILEKKAFVFASDPKKAEAWGIKDAFEASKFEEWAAKALPRAAKVYTKLRQKNLDVVSRHAKTQGQTLAQELVKMRLVKSAVEIKLLKKAADATNRAHVAAMKGLKAGMNEGEIQKIVTDTFKKEGCPDLGFPPICGSGANGTILHYMDNNQEIPAASLIVTDIGAAIENYVTDITRTLPTSGKFTDPQRSAYQCVLDAQKAAEAVCRPGATLRQLDQAAAKVFKDRKMTEWSYAHSRDGSVRHGLGHFVGMHVHDSGSYDTKFEPGMVITIEPGWYDKDSGWGIRIEDTYVITAGGFDRLSKDAPREIAEIEKIMAGK
jgi:Xaa-Pro aminopeptidase